MLAAVKFIVASNRGTSNCKSTRRRYSKAYEYLFSVKSCTRIKCIFRVYLSLSEIRRNWYGSGDTRDIGVQLVLA